jgi:hypothetical protein
MHRSLLFALVVALSTAARACPASDPLDTARALHARHYVIDRNDQGLGEILSPALWGLLVKNWKCEDDGGGICAIEADPWTDAQDGEMLTPPTFRLVASTATTAKVEAAYRFGWKESADKATDEKSFVLLVKDAKSSCWRVDDLIGAHGNSLARTLREYR